MWLPATLESPASLEDQRKGTEEGGSPRLRARAILERTNQAGGAAGAAAGVARDAGAAKAAPPVLLHLGGHILRPLEALAEAELGRTRGVGVGEWGEVQEVLEVVGRWEGSHWQY